MNLSRLMSATRAIGTVREKPAVFVTEALPSFGWPKDETDATHAATKRRSTIWRVLWPFSRTQPKADDPPPRPPRNSPTSATGGSWLSGWQRRTRTTHPAQRGLVFETLKPVRNDLRDEDYEVTTRARTASTKRTAVAPQPLSGTTGRQALLSLELPAR